MDEQTCIDAINKSMRESERQMIYKGRPMAIATREHALKQVEKLEAAHGNYIQEEILIDECESLHLKRITK